MHIALVTARKLPRPDHDLPILVEAFAARGVQSDIVAWEDSTVQWSAFDAAIIRSTWNYLEHYEAFRAWMAATARATRLVNPLAVLEWNLHKSYLMEFARAGIAVVATELVRAGEDADWSALFARHGELVVKPAISAGSFATIRVARGDAATAIAHRSAHAQRDFLVQPLLQSVLKRGEANLVHFGGRFSHAVSKHARWDGDDEQARGSIEVSAEDKAFAQRVLNYVGCKGLAGCSESLAYARVDVAHDEDDHPMLMELELIEPSLFLTTSPANASMLVDAVIG